MGASLQIYTLEANELMYNSTKLLDGEEVVGVAGIMNRGVVYAQKTATEVQIREYTFEDDSDTLLFTQQGQGFVHLDGSVTQMPGVCIAISDMNSNSLYYGMYNPDSSSPLVMTNVVDAYFNSIYAAGQRCVMNYEKDMLITSISYNNVNIITATGSFYYAMRPVKYTSSSAKELALVMAYNDDVPTVHVRFDSNGQRDELYDPYVYPNKYNQQLNVSFPLLVSGTDNKGFYYIHKNCTDAMPFICNSNVMYSTRSDTQNQNAPVLVTILDENVNVLHIDFDRAYGYTVLITSFTLYKITKNDTAFEINSYNMPFSIV